MGIFLLALKNKADQRILIWGMQCRWQALIYGSLDPSVCLGQDSYVSLVELDGSQVSRVVSHRVSLCIAQTSPWRSAGGCHSSRDGFCSFGLASHI